MVSLYNLVEERANQIQKKEIQIALSNIFRITYSPFCGGGYADITDNTVK